MVFLTTNFNFEEVSMKKLFARIKKLPKVLVGIFAVLAIAVIIPAATHAWGPSRPTYGSAGADHVTFDSITDNPSIGDERNFVGICDASICDDTSAHNGDWYDTMALQPGHEYVVRLYVHNDAAAPAGQVAGPTATGVKAIVTLPGNTGTSFDVQGDIHSTNATPNDVWDDATFTSSTPTHLSYVEGSAKYYNNYFTTGFALGDSLFTNAGAPLGYNKTVTGSDGTQVLDGNIPGCYGYSGYLTFLVKADNFTTNKQVSVLGSSAAPAKTVSTTPGSTVKYTITYQNTSADEESNVVVKDTLPTGVTYIPGTSNLTNRSNPTGKTVSDNLMTAGGINIGDYSTNSIAVLTFNAQVTDATHLACGTNTFVNTEHTIVSGLDQSSTANVTVNKSCVSTCTQDCNQLPHTGPTETLLAFFGIGALTASVIYYLRSRRA